MTWGFIWLMVVLKIPIAALLYIVWWAVRQDTNPDPGADNGDGGTKVHPHGDGERPRLPKPKRPRGPHGDPSPPAPKRARTRTTVARSRDPARCG
jgi:hypothetical protein